MEIDFHFGVTYIVGRIAGLDHEKATIVATCSQYVDDTVNSGALNFKTGQAYYRISSAHDLSDYHILLPIDERQTWIPFHFLPGNDASGDHSEDFFNRIVCRPNSQIAQAMVRACIEKQDATHGLHRLGITAHVFIDTWAHQGFAGINHPINVASQIAFISPVESRARHWWEVVREGGVKAILGRVLRPFAVLFTTRFFPMGHGTVLHYPDHPFRKWTYRDGHGRAVLRDNPTAFLQALEELCRAIRRFIQRDPDAVVEGLPPKDREVIQRKILELTDEDPLVRLQAWRDAAKRGEFSFGSADPVYLKSGEGSWKHQALGTVRAKVRRWDKFDYSAEFLRSNWKLFHDAALAHQHDILHEILPRFGICAI